MPPKKKQNVRNTREIKKAADDKTFGMKNKKGKKAQMIQKTHQNTRSKAEMNAMNAALDRKAMRQEKLDRAAEDALLFRKVETRQKMQQVPAGVDPKSVVCIYFKRGNCQWGDKCKLSHILEVQQKSAKADMFVDKRDEEVRLLKESMEDWDEETFKEMLKKKNLGRPVNASEKICKYFLKAVEKKQWGWFWKCPNAERCPYRHALPEGYVLDKDKKAAKIETRALEEVLEEERAKIITGTKVTPESFKIWKEKIKKQQIAADKKAGITRQQLINTGKQKRTGREILSEDPKKYINEKEAAHAAQSDSVDIVALMKQKADEEAAIDQENAVIAAELAAEVEKDLQEQKAYEAEKAAEAAAEAAAEKAAEAAAAVKAATTTTADTITPTDTPTDTTTDTNTAATTATTTTEKGEGVATLDNVDKSLFVGDGAEDLDDLDFSDSE